LFRRGGVKGEGRREKGEGRREKREAEKEEEKVQERSRRKIELTNYLLRSFLVNQDFS